MFGQHVCLPHISLPCCELSRGRRAPACLASAPLPAQALAPREQLVKSDWPGSYPVNRELLTP